MKFYICKHCGNVITKLTSAQVPVKCCGEEMQLLEAGVTDAAQEKHVPAVTVEGGRVKVDVGSVTHPMTAEHFIQWVVVETERDALIHWFHPEEAPEAVSGRGGAHAPGAPPAPATPSGFGRRHLKAASPGPPPALQSAPGRSFWSGCGKPSVGTASPKRDGTAFPPQPSSTRTTP